MPATTKSSDQDLIIFVNVIQTTITRNKCCNLFRVLDQLHSRTFTNSRVGLFRFDSTIAQVAKSTLSIRRLRRRLTFFPKRFLSPWKNHLTD
ncbi:unnamed protein product [Albugo candida]|uniref:Uncharacterized protein n=1 Tax=Albugo candida TaxID=65357 RepID=A0A024GBI7_9STRA|nr:unnamed protein product [Albugo candida]|eukprot:CCI43702.1 unnamed protein product [Albugo candida]